jgi:hypothetical protein
LLYHAGIGPEQWQICKSRKRHSVRTSVLTASHKDVVRSAPENQLRAEKALGEGEDS